MEDQFSNPQPQQGYNDQSESSLPVKPDSHLGLAIFVTLCCCLPLGIVAILKANKVNELYNTKQYEAAAAASADAKKWCMYGLIGYVIWVIIVIIIYAVAGAAAFGLSGLS